MLIIRHNVWHMEHARLAQLLGESEQHATVVVHHAEQVAIIIDHEHAMYFVLVHNMLYLVNLGRG